MSVNPGFGGQKFIPQTNTKVKQLKDLIKTTNSSALIQVDGGVDQTNAKALFEAGADCLVAGSYVFKSDDPFKAIETLKNS
jgi:ribulose-phosphate 3-epimerase